MSIVREIVDRFCEELKLEKVEDVSRVVNNGAKSIKSILSKVQRQYYSGDRTLSLSKINDLSRCALIVNSYKTVPNVLLELKKKYPDMVGVISRHNTGYRGIHLKVCIDGINVEIQVSTADAWLVKQTSEFVYAKWREFEQEIPLKLIQLQKARGKPEFQQLRQNFIAQHTEYVNDYRKINNLFEELQQYLNLDPTLPKVESILLSYQIDTELLSNKNVFGNNAEELQRPLVDIDGELLEGVVLEEADKISAKTSAVQEKMISEVKYVLETCLDKAEKKVKVYLTPQQKFVFELRETLTANYNRYFENNPKFTMYTQFCQPIIASKVNRSVIMTTKDAIICGVDFNEMDVSNYLAEYSERVVNRNLILTQENFVKNIENEIISYKQTENMVHYFKDGEHGIY